MTFLFGLLLLLLLRFHSAAVWLFWKEPIIANGKKNAATRPAAEVGSDDDIVLVGASIHCL